MYKKMWMISRPVKSIEKKWPGIKRIFTRTLKTLENRKSQKENKWK